MTAPNPAVWTIVALLLGIFYILLCWAAGNALSALTGSLIPGNIIGMVLLFAALSLGIFPAERVRPAARFLLGTMALFFVPFGVGLTVSYETILRHLWAIVISAVVSTVVVLLVAGRIFQALNRRK